MDLWISMRVSHQPAHHPCIILLIGTAISLFTPFLISCIVCCWNQKSMPEWDLSNSYKSPKLENLRYSTKKETLLPIQLTNQQTLPESILLLTDYLQITLWRLDNALNVVIAYRMHKILISRIMYFNCDEWILHKYDCLGMPIETFLKFSIAVLAGNSDHLNICFKFFEALLCPVFL